MIELDPKDRALLNVIQGDFPIDPRPYLRLADRLQLTEADVIARVKRLKAEKIIRQISAIFDTRALGYNSSLVAMSIPPERLDKGAAIINTHPGVSHNYKRNHDFNLWFTIALLPTSDLEATVNRLHELAGARSTRILPTLHLFKIGVEIDMTGEAALDRRSSPAYTSHTRDHAKDYVLTADDIKLVHAIQDDLEATPRPYLTASQALGISEEELLNHAGRLMETGHLRRVAAILFHRRAGYAANGMAVWKVPEDRVYEVGEQMATFSVVSHCYLRPVYPDWQYNIFSMLHGRKARDCQKVAQSISEVTGIAEYAMLYSTKEYKKTRVRYFTPELDGWEAKYLEPLAVVAS